MYILLLVLVFQSANLNLRDLSAQLAIPDHDPSCESRYQLYRYNTLIFLTNSFEQNWWSIISLFCLVSSKFSCLLMWQLLFVYVIHFFVLLSWFQKKEFKFEVVVLHRSWWRMFSSCKILHGSSCCWKKHSTSSCSFVLGTTLSWSEQESKVFILFDVLNEPNHVFFCLFKKDKISSSSYQYLLQTSQFIK